jgi:tRNA-dihydrouridine synthase
VTREEASKDAINYIMALIKRDSKPVNPEVNIMIKLFEKMNENKSKTKYFDELQAYLKYRLTQIRLESSRRGQLLPIEIEEGAKQAL